MPATSRSWSRSWSDVGSSRAENALKTRMYRYSGVMCPPRADMRARNWFCALWPARVQLRMSASLAVPPAVSTLPASEGARRTTTKRCAVETAVRTPSTPCQPASLTGVTTGVAELAPVPAKSRTPASPTTGTRRARLRERRVGIETEICRARERVGEARGRGDHRRIVRAEGEGRESRCGQRSAERRVRRDAPDDRHLLEPRLLDRVVNAALERADDRVLVRRREVGFPPFDLGLSEVPHGVEKRR